MSLFASFLGNAANAGAEYLGNEIKNENQMKRDEALERMREELLIKRTETIEAMKRSRDLKAGQDISAEADIIGKARIDKDVQSKMAADPELNGMQPGDQEALDKATPKQLKEVGLMDTYSRASRQDDVATAATKLGYKEEAQLARGQQQIENARDVNERMILANEKRSEHDMRRDENADKRATNADAYNNKHLDEIIRHNKALEGAARERSGAEKLSPAAKVQLEIASSRVGSAQKEESLAATALNIISKEGQMADPVKLKEAKDAYGDAKKNVTNAFDLYNKTGKAHLGESWKELETTQPEKQKPPPDGTRGQVGGVMGTVVKGEFVPDSKPNKDVAKGKQRDPSIPEFSTFNKTESASSSELASAQQAVDSAKSQMEVSRNAQTMSAYNQAVTNLTALKNRGR